MPKDFRLKSQNEQIFLNSQFHWHVSLKVSSRLKKHSLQIRLTEQTYLIQSPRKTASSSPSRHYQVWPPLLNTFSVHLMEHLQQPTCDSDSVVHKYFVATLLLFFCTKTRISFPTVKMDIANYCILQFI